MKLATLPSIVIGQLPRPSCQTVANPDAGGVHTEVMIVVGAPWTVERGSAGSHDGGAKDGIPLQ